MKKIILISTMLLLFTGCNEGEAEQQENPIYGTWQLFESFSHPPSGSGWEQANNGFKLIIKPDNSFISTQFSNCETGSISLVSSQIHLMYDCNGFTAGFENPAGVFTYSYKFVENKLEITPQNFNCFEGCKYRLIKI